MRSLVATTILCCTTMSALAQNKAGPSKTDEPDGSRHLLIKPYVTGTGATVDKPGVPQASGPTPLDRRIQRQDNRIDDSICKGCAR